MTWMGNLFTRTFVLIHIKSRLKNPGYKAGLGKGQHRQHVSQLLSTEPVDSVSHTHHFHLKWYGTTARFSAQVWDLPSLSKKSKIWCSFFLGGWSLNDWLTPASSTLVYQPLPLTPILTLNPVNLLQSSAPIIPQPLSSWSCSRSLPA